jgi:hypothetical protein
MRTLICPKSGQALQSVGTRENIYGRNSTERRRRREREREREWRGNCNQLMALLFQLHQKEAEGKRDCDGLERKEGEEGENGREREIRVCIRTHSPDTEYSFSFCFLSQ